MSGMLCPIHNADDESPGITKNGKKRSEQPALNWWFAAAGILLGYSGLLYMSHSSKENHMNVRTRTNVIL